jgi:hypothetical protein
MFPEAVMTPLSQEEQQALDAASGAVPRVAGGDGVYVLLAGGDFDWIRGLVPDVADAPRRIDPRTGRDYALLPLAAYERFKAFFEEDPVSPQERQHLLREFGRRAGWDDPELDVYEEYR